MRMPHLENAKTYDTITTKSAERSLLCTLKHPKSIILA